MIKTIKFDLKLNNGETLRTLDDLKNNLSPELFEHFQSGKLAKWLRVRKLEEQADAVEKLLTEIHDREVRSFKGLIELFGGEANVDSLRTAIAERKKALPFSVQNSDDEVELLETEKANLAIQINQLEMNLTKSLDENFIFFMLGKEMKELVDSLCNNLKELSNLVETDIRQEDKMVVMNSVRINVNEAISIANLTAADLTKNSERVNYNSIDLI